MNRAVPESAARRCAQELVRGRVAAVPGSARATCAANIALVKYWGKRDEALNLPVAPSLSVSTGAWGSTAEIAVLPDAAEDEISLNGARLAAESPFAARLSRYLDLFRPDARFRFAVKTSNAMPTAAGFASSASGFAAVAVALDGLFGWGLRARELSVLARLGSGSAARSIEPGFVEWRAGKRPDGLDSSGVRLAAEWPALRLGAVVVSGAEKPVGSKAAMRHCKATCPFYGAWPATVEKDLRAVRRAIRERDMALLGGTAEANALAMHALMLASRPSVFYPLPETLAAIRRIQELRADGVPVWFTMDAGPNPKLLFEAGTERKLRAAFPKLEVLAPFGGSPQARA